MIQLRESRTSNPEAARDLTGPISVSQALSTINSINSAITHSSDLTQALNDVLDAVLRVTHAEGAEVFLREEPSRDMVLSAYRGLFRGSFYQIPRFHPGNGFPGLLAATAEPIVTTNLPEDSRYLRSKVKEKGFRSYVCVPLMDDGGVLGSLNIAYRHREEDILSHLQFLSWAASPLSAAVQLGRLRVQDLIARYQAEPGPDPEPGLDHVLNHVLEKMVAAGQADGGAVMLRHPLQETLRSGVTAGVFQDTPGCGFSCGEAGGCPALARRESVVLVGPRRSWEPACRAVNQGMKMVVCVPLLADGVAGVIALGYRGSSTLPPTRNVGMLSAMAARAALVVRNVAHYLETQEPATSGDRGRTPGKGEGALHRGGVPATGKPPQTATGGPSESPPALDIRCFGRFRIYRDGRLLRPSNFPRRKALTALKILITRQGKPIPKDALIEFLWPEGDPETAGNRLYGVIHALRRGLESQKYPEAPPFILTDGDSYRFNMQAPYRLDVDEFLQGVKRGEELEAGGDVGPALKVYRAAARLYTGDFLEEDRYSDWCSPEREYLRERYLFLLQRIALLLAENGEMENCVKYYRRALLADNLREETHRELMRCLWRAGRRDEALRQYRTCRALLADELGVDPLEETENLYVQVLGDGCRDSRSQTKIEVS